MPVVSGVSLDTLYIEIDRLLTERERAWPERVEPNWGDLSRRIGTLETVLRERARGGGAPSPSAEALACADGLVDSPVFVLGFNGSGTTLLNRLLDGHPDLTVIPVETKHFVRHLPSLRGLDRTAQEDLTFGRWLHWLINPFGKTPFWILGRPWEGEGDPYERFAGCFYSLAERYRGRDLLGVVAAAIAASELDELRIDRAPRLWAEKTPKNELRIGELLAAYPRARFLHVIRDPRSTVASRLARPKEDPWTTVLELRLSLLAALRNSRELGPNRYLLVRYEDLVSDPPGVMQRVAAFLGIEFDDGLLVPTTYGTPFAANSAWDERRVTGAIHRLSVETWREHLDPESLELLLAYTAVPGRELGYDLNQPTARSARIRAAKRVTHVLRRLRDAPSGLAG